MPQLAAELVSKACFGVHTRNFFRNRSQYPYQRLCSAELRLLPWLVSGKNRDCIHPTKHFRRNR